MSKHGTVASSSSSNGSSSESCKAYMLWNVVVDNNVMGKLSALSSVSYLRSSSALLQSLSIHLEQSSLTPRSHKLSSSLPKLTVLSVAPMHDTVASQYVPSSSLWVQETL